jgi:TonB family protein
MNDPVERALASYLESRIADTTLTVKLSVSVIERLSVAVMDGFKAVPRRGLEVGGLLLGRIEGDCVLVDDFSPVACEHVHGPSWLLSEKEKAFLADEISRVNAEQAGPRVLGMYRSHTREGIAPSAEDQALMREYCAGDAAVFLLVKPDAGGLGTAAWFAAGLGLWDRPAEFPPRRRELLSGAYAVEAPAPVVPEAPHRPEVIRFRMAKLLETAASRGREIVPPPPAAGCRKPWLAPLAILLGSAFAGYLLSWSWIAKPRAPVATSLPITLRVTLENGSLHLHWDRNSALVRTAAAGIIWIDDGATQRRLDLQPADLTGGRIQYWPSSNEVRFRMELLASTGSSPTLRATGIPMHNATAQKIPKLARVEFEPWKPRRPRTTFTAAEPLRPEIPPDPAGPRAGVVVVNVKVEIDAAGKVARAEMISRPSAGARDLDNLALKSSRLWTFIPARNGDRRVYSKGVLHYSFGNAVVAEARAAAKQYADKP